MSEFKIDEVAIKDFALEQLEILEMLRKDIAFLTDENNDPFARYMSFSRLQTLDTALLMASRIYKMSFRLGFDANIPVLQTKVAEEMYWTTHDPLGNPFFEFEKPQEKPIMKVIDGDNLPKGIRDGLIEALEYAISSQKEPVVEKVH
jgi:hypothetical protein